MSRIQEGSLLRQKRKTGPDAWVFRWYDESNGERKYRKSVIGAVDRLPTRHAAEVAILALRRTINSENRAPEAVTDLIAHYRKDELVPERKAFPLVASRSSCRPTEGLRCTDYHVQITRREVTAARGGRPSGRTPALYWLYGRTHRSNPHQAQDSVRNGKRPVRLP
jgi:hypothetical protein